MSEQDVAEQKARREIHGGDALLRKTTKIDLSVVGKQAIADPVPAGFEMIVDSIILGNAGATISAYNGMQSISAGFSNTFDDLFSRYDVSALSDPTKNFFLRDSNGLSSYAFRVGVAGETLGIATGETDQTLLPGKKIRVSGDLIQKTIATFDFDVSKIDVTGNGNADDSTYIREPGTTNGKRRFVDINGDVGYFEWDSGSGRWVFWSNAHDSNLYESFDDTAFPSQAAFVEVGTSNPAPFSATLAFDTYTMPELKHIDVHDGKRQYQSFVNTNYFYYDAGSSVWKGFVNDVELLRSEPTNQSDPVASIFALPDSPLVITITDEPSPILGDYWEAGSRPADTNRLYTKNGIPFGSPNPYIVSEIGPAEVESWDMYADFGNPIFYSTDNPTGPGVDPVGATFIDYALTGGGIPTITELPTGPTMDVTVLYFLRPV